MALKNKTKNTKRKQFVFSHGISTIEHYRKKSAKKIINLLKRIRAPWNFSLLSKMEVRWKMGVVFVFFFIFKIVKPTIAAFLREHFQGWLLIFFFSTKNTKKNKILHTVEKILKMNLQKIVTNSKYRKIFKINIKDAFDAIVTQALLDLCSESISVTKMSFWWKVVFWSVKSQR